MGQCKIDSKLKKKKFLTFESFSFQVDSYYSHSLCTPDGYYRKYYCNYPAGTDIRNCEPADIITHLDRVGELELDFGGFSSSAISCFICKFIFFVNSLNAS